MSSSEREAVMREALTGLAQSAIQVGQIDLPTGWLEARIDECVRAITGIDSTVYDTAVAACANELDSMALLLLDSSTHGTASEREQKLLLELQARTLSTAAERLRRGRSL